MLVTSLYNIIAHHTSAIRKNINILLLPLRKHDPKEKTLFSLCHVEDKDHYVRITSIACKEKDSGTMQSKTWMHTNLLLQLVMETTKMIPAKRKMVTALTKSCYCCMYLVLIAILLVVLRIYAVLTLFLGSHIMGL